MARWGALVLALVLALAPAAAPAQAPAQAPTPASVAASGGSDSGALVLRAGRFTIGASAGDARLARALLAAAQANDTFPGLPRPQAAVRIDIARDAAHFRSLTGAGAPEWGAAIALPDARRIVMQGRRAGADAGDPLAVLRHELAHLALHEAMGALPPRWFDEGYASVAAGEFTREQLFETSIGLVWRTLPSLDALEAGFTRGGVEAGWSYALAYRVVRELEQLGGDAGLTPFLGYWRASGSFEKAVRQAYGLTGEGFEQHWRRQTRRRYGALAVVTNVSAVLGVFAVLLVPLFVSKRRRDQRKLEAMRAADAAQSLREQASALQALLDGTPPAAQGPPLPGQADPRYAEG